jgi:hypothetical protein
MKFITLNRFACKNRQNFFFSVNCEFLQFYISLLIAIKKEDLQVLQTFSHKILFYFYPNILIINFTI